MREPDWNIVEGSPWVPCTVEGCPRDTPEGWVEPCGMAELYRHRGLAVPAHIPGCGSEATVDLWYELGLMD